MNRTSILASLVLLSLACGPDLTTAGDDTHDEFATATSKLTQVSSFGSNPGNLSMYLYVPANVPSGDVAVVVAMHGCAMSANSYVGAGWNTLADQLGFIVVYPQTTASASCFGWFNAGDIRRDGGQVLSVKQMVDYVKSKYPVSKAFVTGLSAGGAMAEAALAAYPDVFSAGAVMAGIPYNCGLNCMSAAQSKSAAAWGDLVRNAGASGTSKWPRIAIWHGASDSIVAPVNADESVTQWTNVHGLSDSPTSTESIGAATVKRYADSNGTVLVEQWKVAGMNHGSAVDPSNGCGQAGSYLLDVKLCSSGYAAKFFGLTGGGSDGGVKDAGTDAGTKDAGTDAGTKDAGTDAGTKDAGPTDSGVPDAGPKDAGPTDSGVPDAGPKDAGPTDAGQKDAGSCSEIYATNYAHTQAHRAGLCNPYNGHACAVGSNADIGLWSLAVSTWVREPRAGYFEPGRCQ